MSNDNIVMLEALAFALPLLGIPGPTIVQLIIAAPLLLMSWSPGAFGLLLLGGLAVPAVLTLMRLRQLPPAPTTTLTEGT